MPSLSRNVRLYPWFAASFNAFFWMPVFFLFFSAHVSLEEVLRLEAIYYAAVVVLEAPSGYFSDAVGRRKTLLIASASLVAAYGLFLAGSSFTMFAAAQVLLAGGIAFASGTDTSFHCDSLEAAGRGGEFAEREAAVARKAFQASAVAALLGGLAGAIDLRLAYVLSCAAAVATFTIALLFVEPPREWRGPGHPLAGPVRQLRACGGYLRAPSLRWLFAFAVLMTVLNHVPYEFYQPYIGLLTDRLALPDTGTPILAGLHAAAAMLAGAWFAGRSIRLRDRVGLGPALLLSTALQTVIIAAMGLVLHPLIVALALLRAAPRGLMAAPLNAAVAPRIDAAHRATYLSIQSLAGRLSFSAVLVALSLLAGGAGSPGWPALSSMLRASTVPAVFGLAALGLTSRSLRQASRITPADPAADTAPPPPRDGP